MANLREEVAFGWTNLVDLEGTEVTCEENENPLFPASNLALAPLDKPFRSASGADDIEIVFQFPEVLEWQAIALPLHNLEAVDGIGIDKSNNGTVWLEVDELETGNAGAVDEWPNGGPKRNMFVFANIDPLTSSWVRIRINENEGLAFHELSRAYIGPLWQPGYNMDWGFEHEVDDGDQIDETSIGAEHAFVGGVRRVQKYAFTNKLTEADAVDKLSQELAWGMRKHKDLLVIPFPLEPEKWWWWNLWGKCTDRKGPSSPSFGAWSFNATIKERLS